MHVPSSPSVVYEMCGKIHQTLIFFFVISIFASHLFLQTRKGRLVVVCVMFQRCNYIVSQLIRKVIEVETKKRYQK